MFWFSILFYVLLADALIANALAWSGAQHWWQTHVGMLAKHLPLARGWTLYYLLLVTLLGIILYRSGNLVLPF